MVVKRWWLVVKRIITRKLWRKPLSIYKKQIKCGWNRSMEFQQQWYENRWTNPAKQQLCLGSWPISGSNWFLQQSMRFLFCALLKLNQSPTKVVTNGFTLNFKKLLYLTIKWFHRSQSLLSSWTITSSSS